MKLKMLVTYKISFRSKSALWCGVFLALSIFLRCLHYFIPCDFSKVSIGEWIFKIILPILLCATYSILVRIVKLRSPGIYGILAAALCFTLFVGDLFDSNLLQLILSIVTMPLLAILLLLTFGGYIPRRSICACALLLVCILRFLFWVFSGATWLAAIADISILLGLFSFVVSIEAHEN